MASAGAKKARTKAKSAKGVLENLDLQNIFDGVLGEAKNLHLTYPKYLDLKTQVNRYILVVAALRSATIIKHRFPNYGDHLDAYLSHLRQLFAANFEAPDLAQWRESNYERVPTELANQFSKVFAEVKTCELVGIIANTCNNLLPYAKDLSGPNISDAFLVKSSGLSFTPIPNLSVDFKLMYISDLVNEGGKKFIITILQKLLEIGQSVFEVMMTPDLDVSEFIEIVTECIATVKKQIPRCDQAFNMISNSISTLKQNFGNYYKDFALSGNPTCIMEGFISDVARDAKASATLTRQFQTIIKHYRKTASSGMKSDPKLQFLFKKLNTTFDALSASTGEEDDGAEAGASPGGDGAEAGAAPGGDGADAGAGDEAGAGDGAEAGAGAGDGAEAGDGAGGDKAAE